VSSNDQLKESFLRRQPIRRPWALFLDAPGAAIAYGLPQVILDLFHRYPAIESMAELRAGLQTGDNGRFLRYWHEVNVTKIGLGYSSREDATLSCCKWFPHNKGGEYRRWFGNQQYVIDWEKDGQAIRDKKAADLAAGRITRNNSKCWNQE